jgi:hypothetical protein
MAYGEPRFTNDIDIVADIALDSADALKRCFPDSDYYFDVESLKNAVRKRHQFNIIHPASGLKIDVIIQKGDDFERSRFGRTRRLNISETKTAEFAAPEDVIIKKLEYYQMGGSDKHLRDIASMIKISGSMIDRSYLQLWIEKLGLSELWQSVMEKLQP